MFNRLRPDVLDFVLFNYIVNNKVRGSLIQHKFEIPNELNDDIKYLYDVLKRDDRYKNVDITNNSFIETTLEDIVKRDKDSKDYKFGNECLRKFRKYEEEEFKKISIEEVPKDIIDFVKKGLREKVFDTTEIEHDYYGYENFRDNIKEISFNYFLNFKKNDLSIAEQFVKDIGIYRAEKINDIVYGESTDPKCKFYYIKLAFSIILLWFNKYYNYEMFKNDYEIIMLKDRVYELKKEIKKIQNKVRLLKPNMNIGDSYGSGFRSAYFWIFTDAY
jgi:hypothetical protein